MLVGLAFFSLLFLSGCSSAAAKLCEFDQNDVVEIRGVILDTHVITDNRSTPSPEYTILTIRTQDCDVRALKRSVTYESRAAGITDKVTRTCIEQSSGGVVFGGFYNPRQVNKERFSYQVIPSVCTKEVQKA